LSTGYELALPTATHAAAGLHTGEIQSNICHILFVSADVVRQFHLAGCIAKREPKLSTDTMILAIGLKSVTSQFEFVVIKKFLILSYVFMLLGRIR